MELIVVGLVAGLSFLSYALWKRSRTEALSQALAEERATALLGSSEANLQALRPGDVVTHMTTDYIVEGSIALDEDGRVTRLYRLADGGKVRWLGVRPGDGEPLVFDQIPDAGLVGNAQELVTFAGEPYRLAARASTRVKRAGAIGGVASDKHGERAWLLDYAGVGIKRVWALAWSEHTEIFAGEPVHRGMIDVLPAA